MVAMRPVLCTKDITHSAKLVSAVLILGLDRFGVVVGSCGTDVLATDTSGGFI